MTQRDLLNDLPAWAQEYFRCADAVRLLVPEGWELYGAKKDEATPKYMIWCFQDGQYDVKELVIP